MADERSYYGVNEYDWDCSVDQYDNAKSRDAVDAIFQLLQTGQPFSGEKAKELVPAGYLDPQTPEDKKPVVPTTPVAAPETPETPQPLSKPSPSQNNKSLKHKCDICSQVFDSPIARSIHIGRIHKSDGRDKSHQCPHCPKTFHNASYLSQHKRIHSGHKPYKCEMCSKAFTQLSHLQQHMRTHSGEKPYKCMQPGCTKKFSQLSNLQSHTRSHLPDGNVHKCTSCYKCYFDEKSLNAHLRTHMMNKRVRNYKCDECGKCYTQDTYLQNHINNKHRGGSLDKMNYTPKALPSAQPTSIQAATSMICKPEEQGVGSQCSGASGLASPLMPRGQSVSHSLMPEQKTAVFRPEANYQRPSTLPVQFPSGTGHDCETQQHGSAFKPPPVRTLQQSMEVSPTQQGSSSNSISSNGSQGQQRSVATGYEPVNNNILGLPTTQEMKPGDMERQQQQQQGSDVLWRMRNNLAAAASYSSFNSQIQQYMASGGASYPPSSYSAYMNTPLESSYVDKLGNYKIGNYADKIGSYVDKLTSGHVDMYEDDVTNDDYFMMGGFREAYSMD